jgi:hypothetical protein
MFPQTPEHADAVHDRHAVVEEDQVRPFPRGHRETFLPISGSEYFASERTKQPGETHPYGLAVVHT